MALKIDPTSILHSEKWHIKIILKEFHCSQISFQSNKLGVKYWLAQPKTLLCFYLGKTHTKSRTRCLWNMLSTQRVVTAMIFLNNLLETFLATSKKCEVQGITINLIILIVRMLANLSQVLPKWWIYCLFSSSSNSELSLFHYEACKSLLRNKPNENQI